MVGIAAVIGALLAALPDLIWCTKQQSMRPITFVNSWLRRFTQILRGLFPNIMPCALPHALAVLVDSRLYGVLISASLAFKHRRFFSWHNACASRGVGSSHSAKVGKEAFT